MRQKFKKLDRIYILGTVGSGKSSLAKRLSKLLGASHYDLDNLVWTKTLRKKFSEKTRDKKFNNLIKKRKWVIEGAYSRKWIEKGIKKSNLIILLKPSFKKLLFRITKRFLRRKSCGRNWESWKDYVGLLNAGKDYNKKGADTGYYRHKKMIDKHNVNFVVIKNNRQLKEFLNNLK